LRISARNLLEGEIESVKLGAVMASIKIKVESPGLITALITKESAENLGLKKGDKATAIIKSTEIIVGKE
jgi:molybdopterin-binding protein